MLDVRYRSLARLSKIGTALALSIAGAVLGLVPAAGASTAPSAHAWTSGPALAASGAISGRAASVNGAGLAGICATATLAGRAVNFTATGADGRYMFTGLRAGKYMVEFTACNPARHLFPVWYPDSATAVGARSLTVRAHNVTKGANVVMRAIGRTLAAAAHAAGSRPTHVSPRAGTTGTITGKVVDSSNKAIDGICVEVSGNNGSGFGATGSDGTYSVQGVNPGSYTVEFINGCGASGYLSQWYKNQTSQASANPVTVTAGGTTPNINATMQTGGTISGKATDSSAKAVSGICVSATSSTGGYDTETASDGTYSIGGLATGSYTVQFSSGCGGTGDYLTEWYKNQTSQSAANPVAVTAGKTTANINATMIVGGTVTGKVVNGSATPVSGECVEVSNSTGTERGSSSMSDGTYSVGGLPSGSYVVEFTSECGATGGYLTQWYNGKSSAAAATPVAVTAGKTTPNINATLVVGGTISGKVTNGSGTAIAGLCIEVNGTAVGGTSGFAQSGADGTYSVGGLATGSYAVAFISCGGAVQYLEQWYKGKSSAATATPVPVTAGKTTANINATMVVGGIITGTVTGSGSPLRGICVTATGAGTEYPGPQTSANGTYVLGGLATGSYVVEFQICEQGQNYLSQWWNNESSAAAANPVSVTAGKTTANINAAMHPGGTISGTVKSTTGATLAGICVSAVPVGTGTGGSATTGTGGTYTVIGLGTGSYVVEFSSGCLGAGSYLTQYYKGQTNLNSANPVSVTAGKPTAGVNASLQLAGSITGKVTNAAGVAETEICVEAVPSNAPLGTGISNGTLTLANGTYTITGLPTGTYLVEFLLRCGNTGNFAPQFYKGSAILGSASGVSVTAGRVTPNINAALQAGGEITGKITDQSGKGLAGYCVGASGVDNFFANSGFTTANGTYTIVGLPTSSYTLTVYGCSASTNMYLPQWFRNQNAFSKANPLSVVAGKTTSPVNMALTLGGTITGTVTGKTAAPAAAPLSRVCVTAYSTPAEGAAGYATTSATGAYSIPGLPAGKYAVYFDPTCRGTGNNAGQWYSGKSTFATATPVTVTLGKTTGSVNANLGVGGVISGTALTGGKPAAGVCVDVFGQGSFGSSGFALTSSAGTYSVGNLATGSYLVVFYPLCAIGNTLATQWYNGQTASSKATPVKVTAGATTSGVNANLVAGGSIMGSVSGAGTGKLAGVCVYVQSTLSGGTSTVAQTLIGGSWSVSNLPAGSYTVHFLPGCGNGGNFLSIYYNNQPSAAHATLVAVQSGKVTPGINGTLPVAGIISGKVTTSAGAPVAGACVTVWQGNTEVSAWLAGAGGAWSVYGLATGNYTVQASVLCGNEDVGNFTGAWYKNASSQASANAVAVTTGHTTPGINIPLGVDGTITGTVSAKSGAKLSGICVEAFPATNAPATIAISSGGSYTLVALPPGTYKVEFLTGCGNTAAYAAQWYKNAGSQGAATPITVVSGSAPITGVSATLS